MNYDIRPCSLSVVREMCERYHAYGGAGNTSVYAFAVYEEGTPVASFVWQPPPPGAAVSVCPEAPYGVLALSRMVAVPKGERRLNHISRPLRRQMKHLIDRTRWPVLITYSDEGLGHTGHVYKCSGWEKTNRRRCPTWTKDGVRVSSYRNGSTDTRGLLRGEDKYIQRWEHWACERGEADSFMRLGGWERVPTGKTWRSGSPAFTITRCLPLCGEYGTVQDRGAETSALN